ncbi:tetratricopeptide repeat protein [Spongiimicrobium salis]|uniref:tetratricopeptide repeat protein n=1 Tax=Spongiimicrobium salis TaxID=1667022 RepID=UPI00374D5134
MDRTILIDKYLTRTLNAEEQVQFDALFANDPSFQEEVRFLENVKKVAETEDDILAKAMVADFEAEHQPKSKRISLRKWWVAASLILLAGITYFFMMPPETIDTQELFVESFEPYRNVVHPIVRGSTQQDEKTKAFQYYEMGEYKNALVLFEKLYQQDKEPYYLFYKANALLQLDRAKEAITLLNAHLKTKDTLREKSNWYLAMAYLKLDDHEKAKKMLQKVIAENRYNVKKAKKLLKVLD